MKRFWKILGIAIGGIVAVVVIVAVVAIYVVFTPERLTPIVRDVADRYVTCPHELGDVDLTFFSTFPEFALRVDGLCIVNPMTGSQSDTLLSADNVVARVNVMKFLKNSDLEVNELGLDDLQANLFINENGETNLNVFAFESDTTDTTSSSLPFNDISVEKVVIGAKCLSFVSKKDSIDAYVEGTSLSLKAPKLDDVRLKAEMSDVSATVGETEYAKHLHVGIDIPASLDLDSMAATIQKAEVNVNEFALGIDGEAQLRENGDICIDASVEANEWQLQNVLALLPKEISQLLDMVKMDGKISLVAHAKGVYNDSIFPVLTAHVALSDFAGKVADLPYQLEEVEADADAVLNLNNKKACSATLNHLSAKTQNTSVDAKGEVSELLDDMLCNVVLDLDADMADVAYFLPEKMKLEGRTEGEVKAKIRLSDLTNMRLEKGKISGSIDLSGLKMDYDCMLISIPKGKLALRMPNTNSQRKTTTWAHLDLSTESLTYEQVGAMKAELGKNTIALDASNVLSSSPVICADIDLKIEEQLSFMMDSMRAIVDAPSLTAYAEYDTKDTTHIPVVDCKLDFAKLQGNLDTIRAQLAQSKLTAKLSGGRRDKTQPKLAASIETQSLEATMGSLADIRTDHLRLTAAARRNPAKKEILLQWNPKLGVDLKNAFIQTSLLNEDVEIPAIKFDYSNKDFTIAESEIAIGRSDFHLQGEVKNIGKWLDGKEMLTGELSFTSKHTDVNELMNLFSASEGSEETASTETAAEKDTTAHPFLIPKNVDLTLNTHIEEAVIFDQLAHNLGGKLYIKNDVLVLEEMGFICNAAKLELTAMYKTPRRNHLYVGLDYHMVDINMQELVNMIPQVDSMLPMLRSFRGNAEFHVAAETFTDAHYNLKTSTTRGALSISGKDLVLLDNETFGKIAKLLMFKKKTENKVDSISVEATLFKNEIDVYPFCMSIDNYMAAVGGRHNLDMSFNYNVNLLSPLYLGVNVSGTFDDLDIKLAKCVYAKDFRPILRKDVDTQNANLRKMIKDSLTKSMKQE